MHQLWLCISVSFCSFFDSERKLSYVDVDVLDADECTYQDDDSDEDDSFEDNPEDLANRISNGFVEAIVKNLGEN